VTGALLCDAPVRQPAAAAVAAGYDPSARVHQAASTTDECVSLYGHKEQVR